MTNDDGRFDGTVRRADRDDFDDVRALLDLWKHGQRSTPRSWVELEASGQFLLARDPSGAPVGLFEGHHHFSNWDIVQDWKHLGEDPCGSYGISLFVMPRSRRTGVGSALLRQFIADAESAGSRLIVILPDEAQDGLRARLRFFRHHGFEWLADADGREPGLMGRLPDSEPPQEMGAYRA